MFSFIIIVVALGGLLLIIKNLFDRPAAQYLKNQDNKDQREHERDMEEIKMKNWKEKQEVENSKHDDDFLKVENK